MLLDADLLAEALRAGAERTGARGPWDPAALLAARAQAEQLAEGREADEPAALFFALARRSRAFGSLGPAFVATAARAQAMAVGHELVMEDLELAMLRAGVLRGELLFEDVRLWFADCLRPLGRP